MKTISIYVLLAALTLILIVIVDVISGVSVAASVQSLFTVIATTTIQETVCMLFFVSLPFIQVIAAAVKRGRSR